MGLCGRLGNWRNETACAKPAAQNLHILLNGEKDTLLGIKEN